MGPTMAIARGGVERRIFTVYVDYVGAVGAEWGKERKKERKVRWFYLGNMPRGSKE